MEKKVFFIIVILILISIMPLAFAAQEDIDNAYDCLEGKINEKGCSGLSIEEQIFAYLAVGKCGNELIASSLNGECWPAGNCNLKVTAQALLALKTDESVDWLLSRTGTPTDITWYLQIEPEADSTCTITYDGAEYSVNIGADNKVSSAAGNCLSLSTLGYWLRIAPPCFGKDFEITCEEPFLTNLLFTSSGSSKIHVVDQTSYATADGETVETVNSFCFTQGGVCDYSGSLWATLALSSKGKNINSYLPYLITEAEENQVYFPEVFLYALTGYEDYYYKIISEQSSLGYWSVSGNRYRDTALALYPFASETFNEKVKAQEWLIDNQDSDGCWNSGSILDTAFILHSVWPKFIPGWNPSVEEVCCESYGFGSNMEECCQEYEWTIADDCVVPENFVGGGKRIVSDSYCEGGPGNGGSDNGGTDDDGTGWWTPGGSDDDDSGTSGGGTSGGTDDDGTGWWTPGGSDDGDSGGTGWSDDSNYTGNIYVPPCASAGYWCISSADCTDAGGNILEYECSGFYVCCDTPKIEKTCAEAGGQICPAGTICSEPTVEYSDTYLCCLGECEEGESIGGCVDNGGVCEPVECGKGYVQSYSYDCEYFGDICCMLDKDKKGGPNVLFWILIVLVILASVAIIFRKKLMEYWFKIKSKFGKKKPTPSKRGPLGMPSLPSSSLRRRIRPRRILPISRRPPLKPGTSSRPPLRPGMRPRPIFPLKPETPSKTKIPEKKSSEKLESSKEKKSSEKTKPSSKSKKTSELDDVLKKLKDIGKEK